ncbi:MAG: hypothetical protein IJ060_08835 [Oscillospiraceae bacterium]|nr:hypothetical protein [Oscillospiraceae bacterium]
MLDFSQPRNQAGLLIAGIGLFFVLMTYGAYIASKRSGHFVSGVPILGGLLIFTGFLISTNRLLCLLALIDPGFIALPYVLLRGRRSRKRSEAVLFPVIKERGFVIPQVKGNPQIRVTTPADSLLHPLRYSAPYDLYVPRLAFMLCADSEGNQYFLLDRYQKNGAAEILPFDGKKITVGDIRQKNQTVSVTVEILPDEETPV